MAFKMKGSPMARNYGSALKTAGHGAEGSHVHTNKDGTSTFYNKDGVKMIKGDDGVNRTPAEDMARNRAVDKKKRQDEKNK